MEALKMIQGSIISSKVALVLDDSNQKVMNSKDEAWSREGTFRRLEASSFYPGCTSPLQISENLSGYLT